MKQHRARVLVAVSTGLMGMIPMAARASDVVEVLPLTDRIVLVHFNDGHVVHHKDGQARTDETVVNNPLNTAAASKPDVYSITSKEDSKFQQPQKPTDVGRKTKGTDFGWNAKWVNGKAVIGPQDHTEEHWLYLTLPQPMQHGLTYTLNTGSLAANGSEWKLVFDEATARSEAVHVNIIGYVPTAPQKYAYLFHWMGDKGSLDLKAYQGKFFHIIDQDTHKPVFDGKVAFRMPATQQETFHKMDSPPNGNFLNADVYECDFSSFSKPGKYVIAVDGIGCSFPFKVDADVYREPFDIVAKGLYHNRSGIALEEPYTKFTRPAPHNPKVTPGFAGKLFYTSVRWPDFGSESGDPAIVKAGIKGPIESCGWYQDAGDWDSYYTHLRPAQELLTAYELAPKNFKPGELNIPESKDGLPDILNEAAWLPRFCYRLRHELMDKKYGTGGIGLRVCGDPFGGDEKKLPDGRVVGQGSWEDVDRIYTASGEDPWSTYRYAGTAAQLAYCLQLAGAKDPQGTDWTKEAVEAYAWAKANTLPGDEKKGPSLKEPRAYAAAGLFRITGNRDYEHQFALDTADVTSSTELWDDRRFGPMVYCLPGAVAKPDPSLYQRIRAALLKTADVVCIETPSKRALRWGGNYNMPMLVGQQTTPWMLEGAVGYALLKDTDAKKAKQYLGALYTTCDYFLGCNALNMTWATGLGVRHPTQVFHMDAWYNGKADYHPGIIVYGPWKKGKDQGAGPWDADWANGTLYPTIDNWPGNERWFNSRCAPLTSEFTIHQNTAPAAAIFGILCAPGPEQKAQ